MPFPGEPSPGELRAEGLAEGLAGRLVEMPAGTREVAMSPPDLERDVAAALRGLDVGALRAEFIAQGSFLHLPELLPSCITDRLVAAVSRVDEVVNRNYIPRHKQGGSVSRHCLDQRAPDIAQLYRSPALMAWLSRVAGEELQVSPDADPHAYALYFYTRAGDHIGWHYDTSYYRGRRYTLLLGVIDESSCNLEYVLHTRESGVREVAGSLRYAPGSLVFFDGDKLKHRITPLRDGERRVSLTFEYVTDPSMNPWLRFISNMKDAVAYFGLRQVFRRAARPGESRAKAP